MKTSKLLLLPALPLGGLLCHSRASLPTPWPPSSSENLRWRVLQRRAGQTKHTDSTSQRCSGSYGSIKLYWSQQLTANVVLITMPSFQLLIKTRWIVNHHLHLTAKIICSFAQKKRNNKPWNQHRNFFQLKSKRTSLSFQHTYKQNSNLVNHKYYSLPMIRLASNH